MAEDLAVQKSMTPMSDRLTITLTVMITRTGNFNELLQMYPALQQVVVHDIPAEAFTKVSWSEEASKLKYTIIAYHHVAKRYQVDDADKNRLLGCIEKNDRNAMVDMVRRKDIGDAPEQKGFLAMFKGLATGSIRFLTGSSRKGTLETIGRVLDSARNFSDKQYITSLLEHVDIEPALEPLVKKSLHCFYEALASDVKKLVKELLQKASPIMKQAIDTAISHELDGERASRSKESNAILMEELRTAYSPDDEWLVFHSISATC